MHRFFSIRLTLPSPRCKTTRSVVPPEINRGMKSLLPPIKPHPGGLQIHAAISFSAFIYPGKRRFLTGVFCNIEQGIAGGLDASSHIHVPFCTSAAHWTHSQRLVRTSASLCQMSTSMPSLLRSSTWNWRQWATWWKLIKSEADLLCFTNTVELQSIYTFQMDLSHHVSYTTWAGQFPFRVFKCGRQMRKRCWYSNNFPSQMWIFHVTRANYLPKWKQDDSVTSACTAYIFLSSH